jgi:hypothetical protein
MAKKQRCACGCGSRGGHDHHVIYRQELRHRATLERSYRSLETDRRNIVPMAFDCHGGHHSGAARLHLSRLPDSCFEFAEEIMGAGAAFEYLGRYYAGEDPRLSALLEVA